MKVYLLNFKPGTGLTKFGNLYRTDIVDLYDNSQYKNYSARRAPYGTNLLNNGVYTGLNKVSATESEIGTVSSGRFIDKSGRIDLIAWHLTITPKTTSTATGLPTYRINAHHSNLASAATPYVDEWSHLEDVSPAQDLYIVDAGRYAYFELDFSDSRNVNFNLDDFDLDLYISVEIDAPAINGFFQGTTRLMDLFPEWMDINEFDPRDPSYATPATPSSLGGKILNAVAGEWLTDLDAKVRYQETQHFIDSVDLSQKAWVYVTTGVPNLIKTITGDGVTLTRTADIQEFYATIDADEACLWNVNAQEIFTNKKYTDLLVNGVKVIQEPYQLWNSLDDIGAGVDLFRFRLEDNDSFRKRILDVFKNRPGTSLDAFKKAIRRELNLWKYQATPATPDSDYLGATPTVYELEDLENDPEFFTERGLPTQKFVGLADELARKYPTTWGYFRYGGAFWDPDGLHHKGYDYLPRLLDATPATPSLLDSGVGDGNDLFVFRPDAVTGEIDFTTKLKIRGRQRTNRSEHMPITFNVDVYGVADQVTYYNQEFSGNFTIEVVVGGVTYFSNITVKTRSDVGSNMATPSPASRALVDWATPDGHTSTDYMFYSRSTGVIYADASTATPTNQIPLASITQVSIQQGHWNPSLATPTYENLPTQANYKLWFTDAPGSIMGSGGSTSLTKNPYTYTTADGAFYIESQLTSNATLGDAYMTEKFSYEITVNDNNPPTTTKNYTLALPTITWPANTSDRKYILQLQSFDETYVISKNDTFDSTDATFWPTRTQVTISGGQAQIGNATAGVLTSQNVTGVAYEVKWENIAIPTTFSSASGSLTATMVLGNGSGDSGFYIVTTANNTPPRLLIRKNNTIVANYASYVDVGAYSATNHRWMRMRYEKNSGVMYYDTSINGTQWVTRHSQLYPATLVNDARVSFTYTGDFENGTPGWFIDNFTFTRQDSSRLYVNKDAATPTSVPHTVLRSEGVNFLGGVYRSYSTAQTQIVFSTTTDGANYPLSVPTWSTFEATQSVAISGTVDENGPWRDGSPSEYGNVNNKLTTLNLTRTDFGIPNTTDYIVTWIGIDSVSSNQVITWLDTNTVKPAVTYGGETTNNLQYPDNAVVETLDGGVYQFSELNVYAKIKPGVNERWLPKVHSGWFHDSGTEYYLYADPGSVNTTSTSALITDHNRQGAPVIVYGKTGSTEFDTMRQISYFDMDTTATPATPSFAHDIKEVKVGNGTNKLFVAYPDIYNISVKNLTTGQNVSVSSATSLTNEVSLSANTVVDHKYQITYRARRSYFVDNNYSDNEMRVVFDSTPAQYGFDTFVVNYEKSIYDPATPIDIPLNTMYTSIDNGFIFIDHDTYPLTKIIVNVSPTQVAADGNDYAMVSVQTLDQYGNPKPGQLVNLYTNFGTLSNATVTTDVDGFGYTMLVSELWDGSLSPSPATPALAAPSAANDYLGRVAAVKSPIEDIADFRIQVPPPAGNRVIAIPATDSILADGYSATSIVGRVETSTGDPVVGAVVYWRKGRTVYEALQQTVHSTSQATPGSSGKAGIVFGDSKGRFTINPFVSRREPGYWFVATEYGVATPSIGVTGDLVVWYEYPNVTIGVDPVTNLPVANNQDATPYWSIPNYSLGSVFPVRYDESNRQVGYTASATPSWEPPKWYAIDRYKQYQMGLYGQQYYKSGATPSHPEYREF